jgi:hypothetical protein
MYGMKLADLRETYQFFSEKTSEIVRNLGFAGIALIWLFKVTNNGRDVVQPELVPAGALIVLGLALDLLHAIVGTATWGIYNRVKEEQLDARAAREKNFDPEEEDFLAPVPINWPALALFWSKIAAMLAAYIILIRFLVGKVI